ncbi:hypothetical protein [Legionella nagasakiensis]|uniref:COG1470 family protein n=1 Tax=Legionella nagasakiensis TaxID=535290 RepID=UPI001056CAA5|nr:hypothetical protein [Legionella nagasakiensis]
MNIKTMWVFIIFAFIFPFSIEVTYAKNEKISLLPTIKAPLLVHINTEANAQYMVKNLGENTVTLALISQKSIKQDTTGLLACSDSFTLQPGQKCLLNLIIKGEKIGQKITHGPLVCETTKSIDIKPRTPFCAQPSHKDSLNITFTKAETAVIGTQPQALTLHSASATPVKLTVTNYSDTITARQIKADLPKDWKDVKQNAKNCKNVKPGKTCSIYFIAQAPHPITAVTVKGINTTDIIIKIMVKPHDVETLRPAADINE